jgi:hypothetical protein
MNDPVKLTIGTIHRKLIVFYFRTLKMSLAAVISLLHDLVLTAGVYGALGFEVTPAAVIGFLTILGYSLYDTVVVFDKVKENLNGKESSSKRSSPVELINLALNQTIVRSANTSFVAVLPVAAILFVGNGLLHAGTLKDLSLSLFIGLIVGTYSSIFIASPILALFKAKTPEVNRIQSLHSTLGSPNERLGQEAKSEVSEVLEGQYIALELLHKEHSANLFKFFLNDPSVWDNHFLAFETPSSPPEMEIIITKFVAQRKITGHDLYAVIEEENDQVIGIVDVVTDQVLHKVYVYETILSSYLRESDYLQEIFELLNHRYLELEGNNFIEIQLNMSETVLHNVAKLAGFEERGIVQNAWRNRLFEYSDAKLFVIKNLNL